MRAVDLSSVGGLRRLAFDVLADEGCFVDVVVGGGESRGDELAADAFLLQVLLDAAAAEDAVFLAEFREVGGEALVGDVVEFLEFCEDVVCGFHAGGSGFGAVEELAAQVARSDCMRAPRDLAA